MKAGVPRTTLDRVIKNDFRQEHGPAPFLSKEEIAEVVENIEKRSLMLHAVLNTPQLFQELLTRSRNLLLPTIS